MVRRRVRTRRDEKRSCPRVALVAHERTHELREQLKTHNSGIWEESEGSVALLAVGKERERERKRDRERVSLEGRRPSYP